MKYFDKKGIDFMLVSASENGIQRAKKDNYAVYEINYLLDEELKKFGIGTKVQTIFCLSSDFNRNLFMTLSARNLDKNIYIVSLASNKEERKKITLAGANKTIDPYAIGANQFFTIMKKPKLFSIFTDILYKDKDVKLEQIVVGKGSEFVDIAFGQAKLEEIYNVVILGFYDAKRDRFIYNIKKILRKIKVGDILVVMGTKKDLDRFKRGLS